MTAVAGDEAASAKSPAQDIKFYFCETCGKRITDQQIREGLGRDKKLKGVYCANCAAGVMTMEMDAVNIELLAKGKPRTHPPHSSDQDHQPRRKGSGIVHAEPAPPAPIQTVEDEPTPPATPTQTVEAAPPAAPTQAVEAQPTPPSAPIRTVESATAPQNASNSATPAKEVTLVFQEGKPVPELGIAKYEMTKDCYLYGYLTNQDVPHLDSRRIPKTLVANWRTTPLIGFSLFQREGGRLPDGVEILDAKLQIYKSRNDDSPPYRVELRRMLVPWKHEEATGILRRKEVHGRHPAETTPIKPLQPAM